MRITKCMSSVCFSIILLKRPKTNFFGGYSNVSLHFISKNFYHQITPYMIITK